MSGLLGAASGTGGGFVLHFYNKPNSKTMKIENAIRALAGTMILASLVLAHYVSPNWLWLTAFVGANLLQSAFTGFCPAENILKKLGVGKGGSTCCG
jgi:hypothetical protein